jgi:crossover junction endodeoxyribonuclease RusA
MSAADDVAVPLAGGFLVTVYGKPVTQGSKVRTRWSMRDDNAERLRPWREAVKQAALDAVAGRDRLDGPVSVAVVFSFDPPKSAPKCRRVWPTTRSSGDVDKLVRAVFDALTDAGVWRDDSQVVRLTASKVHVGDPWSLHIPGACFTVRAVASA